MTLPDIFTEWFAQQGWSPHPHQLALLTATGPSTLLIAPTGGGKTLAGFLPSLVDLYDGNRTPGSVHTIYVSPLKALAADIRRNLDRPVREMGLDLRIEDRTGDTKQSTRQRQRVDPPDMLLTTPESLALMLSYPEAPKIFGGVRRIVLDEIHALAESKRGDQLSLCVERVAAFSTDLRRTGLSATVEDPSALARFLGEGTHVVEADPGPPADIAMLKAELPAPWFGQGGRHAARDVMDQVRRHKTTIIFINTRAQSELFFQALWAENEENLPIGLHHGSLSREARQKVEGAMAAGHLRAVVATGSLDLGIDWGDVDLVIQVGAPKNVKRLVQRIGRANHRYNAPSKALLVPANQFEIIECQVALDAVVEADLDGDPRPDGPLDVLCQHILLTACAAPFDADALYHEVKRAQPYARLSRAGFERCLDYCATGGYALRAYDRYQRLVERDGLWHLRDPRAARDLRMNVGTILDYNNLKVAYRRGKMLGEIEEGFASTLVPGDTFLIGGQVVKYEGLREMTVQVSATSGKEPRIATFGGTKLAMTTKLAHRVLDFLNNREEWTKLPTHTAEWLDLQTRISRMPVAERLLVETFPRGPQNYAVFYAFAGRNAHQTLGIILTRRMEEAGYGPLGFVANDYALMIWSLDPLDTPEKLIDGQDLRAALDTWFAENMVMKRTFRIPARVAGLISQNQPGQRKSGKQATFSTDILYDTLRRYDPDHLMLEITRDEAMRGLVDFDRIEEFLGRVRGRVDHVEAPHVTPLSAPLILEVGRVPVKGEAERRLLDEDIAAVLTEAGIGTNG
ncbi:ligase-associated DNA damage response DEXH box helicase [Pontivivens insulae]|uniref:ATP-dependent DNA helicase RecQ n=1 Tax=Pontivivens insulae TaxID=1639689 RepID=A0A2R8A8Q2_9RHOB|nr:ligase-associated DNA damage response DEXH box helicase [Pontivivens insulae]RED18701.1 ATP-dependent Lhr-like helicase [Pontivivens insulae]SPF28599.1 ATP-dependent DNA helicase RecQ [Pontivivens insulae]